MTTEERAAKVAAKLFRDYPSVGLMLDTHAVYFERDVADAIRAAALEMREKCARVSDSSLNDIGGTIARRIREVEP